MAETVFVKAKEIRVFQEKVCYNEWKGLYGVPIVSSIAIIAAMSSLVVRLSVRLHYGCTTTAITATDCGQ